MKTLLLLLTMLLLLPSIGLAGIIIAGPGNYQSALNNLEPGDTLQLESGTYPDGLRISNRHGTPEQPIIITGPETGDPAVFTGNSARNTVQLNNSSYLTLRYITLDGLGRPYVDAVNSRGPTHHITIENLLIINHGGDYIPDTDHQLTIGIATRGPAWDWIIRNNVIIGAGTGMYLGNSTGRNWPFVGGLIEHNLIVDTLGYSMQIKHMVSRTYSDGSLVPGMPTEDRKTIIRHNVFSKANNASTSGTWARPNLLVGHWPLTGDGSNDIYEIYGNFIYDNPSEALFQGEGNIAMYDNILVNPSGSALHIQPHNDRPRLVRVFHNSIVATGTGIRVSGVDNAYDQLVSGNAVFSATPFSLQAQVQQVDNVSDTYAAAASYLQAPFGDPVAGTLDIYPLSGGGLSGTPIDSSVLQLFTDWNIDFNGDPRLQGARGAYAAAGQNPGWQLALTVKPDTFTAPISAPEIISQPVSQSIEEGSAVSFSVVASGSALLEYQWYRDDSVIEGATNPGYTIAQVAAIDDQSRYHCVVTNSLGSAVSNYAELTVVADITAPMLAGVQAISATQIVMVFNEAVSQESAQAIGNYQINQGIQVQAAVLNADERTVLLQTSNLEAETTYIVTVNNIQDTSAAANQIATNSSLEFVFIPVINFDNGQLPLNWIPLTEERWSVVMEGGSNALFLNTSEYNPESGSRLGEHITSPDSYTDFSFSVKAKTNESSGNGNADYAMVFGFVDGSNYYYMLFNRTQSNTQLFKVASGVRELIGTATAGSIPDEAYHEIELRRIGNSIEVRFDGALVLTAEDSTFPSGKLGLGSYNDSAYFDDIRISEANLTPVDMVFADSFE